MKPKTFTFFSRVSHNLGQIIDVKIFYTQGFLVLEIANSSRIWHLGYMC
jgi:hypothetical protein